MEKAIEMKNVTRKFGDVIALNNINFTVDEQKIVGLLGPNGAGKSTLMKIISTLILPSSGSVKAFGYDVVKEKDKVRKIISLVSDYTVLEDELTPYENLILFGKISNVRDDLKSRAIELLEDFGLSIYKNRLTKNLSSGNKQKLNIARSLIKNPKLLLLDEPTIAIDVETSRFIREYILDENIKNKKTILISSHYMWEVEQIASEVAIIVDGKIVEYDKMINLMKKFEDKLSIIEIELESQEYLKDIEELKNNENILGLKIISSTTAIIETPLKINEFEKLLKDKNIKCSFRQMKISLEDVYSSVTKGRF
ncbi:ABC-type multidrug transport system, ATPase component [Marinitoga piezophila KA3]|uniref:ABC-type multidrug transport system, ATPase component n=1 Tax=Marinitoga piezophila (strain DSM 14283 / JCM 11233 / KA3) TaxID=443254 RepID=H2J5I3_MARPK|nr:MULTISPECIES: ABC transporter ATP-binding protein [Marinitoga]AEX86127.1 ABC-type multidrug transport system, ATPase component [Marinitoga piezophila KA3]APT76542.1 ABC transporter [Marinitoga sp. 1137]NUU98229.1 ABC transporter [Marinitoga sp. 1138]